MITKKALDQIYNLVYDFDETEADSTPRLLALLGEVRGIAWLARENEDEPNTDDLSEHTKYTISYAVSDEEERGFYLIVKDYTGAGMVAALGKLAEMGMDTIGLRLEYENLEGDNLGAKAEDF